MLVLLTGAIKSHFENQAIAVSTKQSRQANKAVRQADKVVAHTCFWRLLDLFCACYLCLLFQVEFVHLEQTTSLR